MQNNGATLLSNRILAAVFRAAVDMCWLIPALYLLEMNLHGTEGIFVAASLFVPALFGSLVLHLRPSRSGRDTAMFTFAAIWIGMTWWLHNRTILQEDVLFGELFTYSLLSLVIFGVCVERGLRAASSVEVQATVPMILYSTSLTALIVLALRYSTGDIMLWPVLLLPLCLVGTAVASRAHIIAPTVDSRELGWRARWLIIAVLVILPFAAALLLLGLSTPGFWVLVGAAAFRIWSVVAGVLVYAVYPFAYIAYLLYQLLKPLVPEQIEPRDIEPAEPPAFDDLVGTGDPLLGGVLTVIARVLILAVAAGAVVWIIRRLRQTPALPGETRWEEERSSLWDPEAFNRRLRDVFRGGEDTAPHYRTRTERIVRGLFREFARNTAPRTAVHYPPHWTPRMFCSEVIRVARACGTTTDRRIRQLVSGYETARYGPAVEREDVVRSSREAAKHLRREPPERVHEEDE